MLKKNKTHILISSLVILLPIVFGVILWDRLPNTMAHHWGAADRVGGKVLAVFGLPLLLLAVHFLCILLTSLDKKQKEQDPKALRTVFWILPILSLFTNGIRYRIALGGDFNTQWCIPTLLSILFLLIGNYLPKVKPNRTLGIKISWTLNNEENWIRTHRFGGKVWFCGGLIILFSVFLPPTAMIWVMSCVIFAMILIPFVYSYRIYRQHQKEGIVYAAPAKNKAEKISAKILIILLPVILVGMAVLLFTGDIAVDCADTSLMIHASYWPDAEIPYADIDTAAYREDLNIGLRTNGFHTSKLSLGTFRNDEFGTYTLYSYTGAKGYIVLTANGKTLVIGMHDAEETRTIYHTLLEKADA